MNHTLLFAAAALALSACSPAPAPGAPVAQAAPVKHGFGPEISAEDFSQHMKVLSSDEFGGRAPGSEGEQKTADYVVGQFKRLGLQPGNGDITLAASHVRGGILVEKPSMGWWNSGNSRKPRIVIGPRSVVDGTLVFEREVELFVHASARIGVVKGATAQAFTDKLPPRE